jgi:chemotaxis protein MotB
MPSSLRVPCLVALAVCCLPLAGCNSVPRYQLNQAQARARQLYDQNRSLMAERQQLMALMGEKDSQLAEMTANGETMRARLENLMGERNKLVSMKSSPLSDEASRNFEDLARRFPGFEFDPQTGVSKIREDLLFASGSDELSPKAQQLLKEFARILNAGESSQLNVLVVGHTDDTRVAKANTKSKHPDNWYLSAHRAISVTHALTGSGVSATRMGVAGYGPHQPRVPSKSDAARKQNRRVEIFVLAPGASMTGWDPTSTIR